MRIAYATTFDAQDVHNWSGTPYHMSQALSDSGLEIDYIGSLKRKLPPGFKVKQIVGKFLSQQRESPRFNCHAAKHYSAQVAEKLQQSSAQAIVSPLINPIAYLECKQPIVLWTDAVYASLLGFYPPFAYHSASSVQQGNAITAECLARCRLAIFSSDWAANNALQLYGVSRDKVKVVPYGANILSYPQYADIQAIIKNRDAKKIKLLFLAKSWERKGGDIVLAVAKALHDSGYPIELNIVGITPKLINKPAYVNLLGFISKQTAEGKDKIFKLLSESHFLFLPSRADACPMVFAEANAHGLPCLTTYVGGISTAVKDDINGMTFGLDEPITAYCDYIINTVYDRPRYEALAMSAHNEYESRLNWKVATGKVHELITQIL